MQLAAELRAAGLGAFPCTRDKSPAIPPGTSWKAAALYPVEAHAWHTGIVGIPVPPGVLVIDLDTYKGVTREQVEQTLGVPLAWDAALIQTTQRGGQHYAFECAWDARQGSDMGDLRGFDTRVGGKGYIATGTGYQVNGPGVLRMTDTGSLPSIPAQCQAVIGHVRSSSPPTYSDITTAAPPDMPTIVDALRHVDPACSRSAWVKIGMALRAWAGTDSDGTGCALFDEWSSGRLSGQDTPRNYVPDHVSWQWGTFKPEGDTTVGTLFYEAIQGGWMPPSRMDTTLAFGPGATGMDIFNDMVERINAHGCDPRETDKLRQAVTDMRGNQMQTATLLALLTRELKGAGLLTKPIRQQLDAAAGDTTQPRARGEYGNNHTENATLYMERFYPHGGLVRSDQTWYAYDGRIWVEVGDDEIRSAMAHDTAASLPQYAVIQGSYSMLGSLCHRRGNQINDMPSHLVIFQNGILDLTTGELGSHDPKYFTTNILPYEYQPYAPYGHWLAFLTDIFQGDTERIELLQEWFGYAMSNSYDHHKIMLLLGAPRSGKGTIGRVLEQIVGPMNYTGASLHAFTSDPFLDSLRTKTIAFSGDTERRVARHKVDTVIERLKKISGNDAVTFGRKFKDTLSQALPTRIVLAGNHVPALFDDSGALAGRLLVLPFDVCYAGREDLGLTRRLMTELPGIATWALEGLRRLTVQGRFTMPGASATEAAFIEEQFSPLVAFVREVCVISGSDDDVTWSDDLYAAYRAWAVLHTESYIMARRTFVGAFKDATRGRGCRYGTVRKGSARKRGFEGLAITPVDTAAAVAFKPAVVGG